ncbi:MAG: TetR/AcrR family transcriptional regulator [Halioglobus sp.]
MSDLNTITPAAEPKMGRREAAAQDKLKRIVQAATVAFAEKGFHGTTIPDVATAANVGAGTIYRYFANKEDLVNAVFINSKTKLVLYLAEGFKDAGESGFEVRFKLAWENLCRFARENPQEFYFLEMQEHSKYLSKESKALERKVLAPLRLSAHKGQKAGEITAIPSMSLIAIVWGVFVGLFKADALGYTQVTEKILADAGDACWKIISAD